jgi:Zn-finger nucleic acid-binding protein
MKCPVCNVDLVMSERSGIEIDYCPQCRGVWLDRGELDKIIEKNVQSDFSAPSRPLNEPDRPLRDERRYKDDDDYYKHRKEGKKKSFLDDIFDF